MDTAERSAEMTTETVHDGFISYSHAADDLLKIPTAMERRWFICLTQ